MSLQADLPEAKERGQWQLSACKLPHFSELEVSCRPNSTNVAIYQPPNPNFFTPPFGPKAQMLAFG